MFRPKPCSNSSLCAALAVLVATTADTPATAITPATPIIFFALMRRIPSFVRFRAKSRRVCRTHPHSQTPAWAQNLRREVSHNEERSRWPRINDGVALIGLRLTAADRAPSGAPTPLGRQE